MCCNNANGDILSGIGDLFISDEQKKLNESYLQDAELERQKTEAMIEYLSKRKALAGSPSAGMDQQTLIVLGGVGVLAVFVIIMMT
jgi:hypothetical protein